MGNDGRLAETARTTEKQGRLPCAFARRLRLSCAIAIPAVLLPFASSSIAQGQVAGSAKKVTSVVPSQGVIGGGSGGGGAPGVASIYVKDLDGIPRTKDTVVSFTKTAAGCEYRLEFNPSASAISRPIKEVSGDRGAPQRQTKANCGKPAFAFTEATDVRQYEEQTVYYWSKRSRDYAEKNLWITPPGWYWGPIKMATEGVQPNVITQGSYNDACLGITASPGCMRAWPHEGPKIHIKQGEASAALVSHEYGHYAAGYVFGHMDPLGASVPSIVDCSKLAFQEAVAYIFSYLVQHDAGSAGVYATSGTDKWTESCANSQAAYATAAPLQEAFAQALWGIDETGAVKVAWPDAKTANRTMVNAFTYALALSRGHRTKYLANLMLGWLEANASPKYTHPIWKIFAKHGFDAQRLGAACADHPQCASLRCDNRQGAGCVWVDGGASSGDFCTTHQQCRAGVCSVPFGTLRGTCKSSNLELGSTCTKSEQCTSGLCNPQSGNLCVPNRNGRTDEFCTDHAQCLSGYCKTTDGKSGKCGANGLGLGVACVTHTQCSSGLCDPRSGCGCVPKGNGKTNDPCTDHAQCSSRLCQVTNGPKGTCAPSSLPLGARCTTHEQCSPGVCHPQSGYVCVANHDGKGGQFCTDHAQCLSRRCIVANGQRSGTCAN